MTWNPFVPADQPANPFATPGAVPSGNPFASASAIPPGWSTSGNPFAAPPPRQPTAYELDLERRETEAVEAAKRRLDRRTWTREERVKHGVERSKVRAHVAEQVERVVLDEVQSAMETLVDLKTSADTDSVRFRAARLLVESLNMAGKYITKRDFVGHLNDMSVGEAVKELTRALGCGEISIEEAREFKGLLELRAGLGVAFDLEARIGRLTAQLDRLTRPKG